MISLPNIKTDTIKRNVQNSTFIINKLSLLSETEREVVILRIIKGYSLRDASILLEKPEDDVKIMQFNAIKKLSAELTDKIY